MDTKELMIGDFVRIIVGGLVLSNARVLGIGTDGTVTVDGTVGGCAPWQVEPILIKDKILDANFKRTSRNFAERWDIRIPGKLYSEVYRWQDDGHYEVLNGVEINYVHELQHVLRLMGQHELANDIKI